MGSSLNTLGLVVALLGDMQVPVPEPVAVLTGVL